MVCEINKIRAGYCFEDRHALRVCSMRLPKWPELLRINLNILQRSSLSHFEILRDNPPPLETTLRRQPPTENTPGYIPTPTRGPDPITDPRRGVLTLTLTLILTDPQGRELSENWH